MLFAADLSQIIAYTSTRTFLAAVWHLHVSEGYADLLCGSMQLGLMMRGTGRTKSTHKDCRLPIIQLILSCIYEILNQHPESYENKLLWVACCLGFFAFICFGKFTQKQWDTTTPLGTSQLIMYLQTTYLSQPDCKSMLRVQEQINGGKEHTL